MRNIAAFFSILMPGFGQIYNQQILKGLLFVLFEHFDNIGAHINQAIFYDFNHQPQQALEALNIEFALFYPGFYVYSVWDAWFQAKPGADKKKTALPFLIAGFLGIMATIFIKYIPFQTIGVGLIMIISMVIGMIIFRKH